MPGRGVANCMMLGMLTVLITGCGQQQESLEEELPPVLQDEALHFRLNGRSEVFLHNRWVNVFNEQGIIRNHLGKQAERYRQYYANEGVALQQIREGNRTQEVLPTEVILEPEPKTKAGTVLCIQRLCREHGFHRFTIKQPETEEAAAPGS